VVRDESNHYEAIREDLLAPVTTRIVEMLALMTTRIVETDDPETEAANLSRDADITLTELDISTIWRRLRPGPAIAASLDSPDPAVFVYSDNLFRYQTIYKWTLMRSVFRGLR
jgi:hypothetical protein